MGINRVIAGSRRVQVQTKVGLDGCLERGLVDVAVIVKRGWWLDEDHADVVSACRALWAARGARSWTIVDVVVLLFLELLLSLFRPLFC